MNTGKLRTLDVHLNAGDEVALLVEQYFANHPGSPSAVRQPKVLRQGDTSIAVLGPDMQRRTVEHALRAFDFQYLSILRPPAGYRVSGKLRMRGGR